MMRIVLVTLAASLFALGCGDPTTSGSGSTASASPAPLADTDVPVAADFEEEAEKSISASNYKGELDTLEKEVDSAN
jgi:ABC-type glycerol-3-phosphate transport system substrate-binding protein